MKKLVVGHPLRPGVHIGAVADARQMEQNLNYLEVAKKEGGNLVYGGEVLTEETEGYYMQPALFTETTNQMTINREEAFAPIACIIRVKDYDEALATLNDTNFGLTGGICTESLKYATDFKRNAKTGCVMVNLPTAGTDYHVPFGGRKDSSFGPREQGTYAKEFYTVVKTTYIRG